MKERYFEVDMLIRIQQITWYLVMVYFAAIYVLFMLDFEGAFELARYGIILILGATVLKLVVLAERFRIARLRRFWLLSYLLVLILAAVAVLRYLL
ncbi:MAG: hypothetical protein JSU74_06585 [Candidatus Zixiibacteriota bacterium]|nr:MAG: hypothetical protein JSU74_06585 [candidate division Zixibacteria bacterium]